MSITVQKKTNAKHVANGTTLRVFVDYKVPAVIDDGVKSELHCEWMCFETDFRAISPCKAVSREPRYLEFVCVRLDFEASHREIIAEMKENNLRPAIYEEFYAFVKTQQDEGRLDSRIFAIGSVCGQPHARAEVICLSAFDWGGEIVRVVGQWEANIRDGWCPPDNKRANIMRREVSDYFYFLAVKETAKAA